MTRIENLQASLGGAVEQLSRIDRERNQLQMNLERVQGQLQTFAQILGQQSQQQTQILQPTNLPY